MTTRIVVDPLTRIEGHLLIEAEVKNGNPPKKKYGFIKKQSNFKRNEES